MPRAILAIGCVVVMVLVGATCSSPVSPLRPQKSTISGYIYVQSELGGEPAIPGVRVRAREEDGAQRTALTDAKGFYTLSVRWGNVSLAASKDGYEAKAWSFLLENDTVLNFSLSRR